MFQNSLAVNFNQSIMYNISLGLRSLINKSIQKVFLISLTEGIKQNNLALEKQVIQSHSKQHKQTSK